MAPLILNTYPECLYVYSIFSFFQRTLLTFKLFMQLLGLASSTGSEEEKEESNTCTDSYRGHNQHVLRDDRCGWLPPASIFHTVRLGTKQRGSKSKGYYHTVCVTQEAFPSAFLGKWKPWEWRVFLKPHWENHSQGCLSFSSLIRCLLRKRVCEFTSNSLVQGRSVLERKGLQGGSVNSPSLKTNMGGACG